MTTFFKSLIVLVATASIGFSAPLEWMTNFNAAKAKAKAENKVVLMDFTGSDWCPWCIKLDKEVFATKEFGDYATKNLVLLKVDFPHNKKQDPALLKQNEQLFGWYAVQGFPTIKLVKPSGWEIGETGYESGGASRFVTDLKKLLKN